MKKILCITAGLLFCAVSIQTAFAASGDVTQAGGAGTDVTIEVVAANVPGAQSVVFTPSTNVNMSGQSSATNFALGAWHQQAVQKDNGQGYGMASDSNKMYFLDISVAANTVGAIGATTAAANFIGQGAWHTL